MKIYKNEKEIYKSESIVKHVLFSSYRRDVIYYIEIDVY